MITDFVLTGSRVYGPAKSNSDLDIVMFYWDLNDTIIPLLEEYKIPYIYQDHINKTYKGIKFMLHKDFPPIQIIAVENLTTMAAWGYATNKMYKINSILNRTERIEVFTNYREEYLQNHKEI